MEIKIVRKGITPAVRPVPTDTTLMVLPMTLDRVNKEVAGEDELAVRVDSVDDAFAQFKPSIHFETQAGEEQTEFVVDLSFDSIKSFSPENIQKKSSGKRNDVADLRNAIDLLYRMKDRWALPAVKRAWNDPSQRKQIMTALSKLRAALEKATQTTKGGE